MTSRHVAQNPFCELDADGEPIYRLKLSLVLYLDYAPGPKRARAVYDTYMARFGEHISVYQSTSWMGPPFKWNARSRMNFETRELPDIQKHADWGYAFSDGTLVDNHLFMFHGYKPVTEAGKASFFRFEWPWNYEPSEIGTFAAELAGTVPFLSGTGGYIVSVKPFDEYGYNRMFALVRRYWGLEAWNLDLTVKYTLDGYKCPSWLTMIGKRLLKRIKRPIDVEAIASYGTATAHGLVYQSRSRPEVIDRNRAEPYEGEQAIARALLPLQIKNHAPFGGTSWADNNTLEWLYRFSL